MTRLCDFPWWPNTWIDEAGGSLSPIEIRTDGVLKNVRRANNELTLMVQHNGSICTAKTGSQMSEELVVLLRHILLQHWGEPISAVEDFEVDFGDLS